MFWALEPVAPPPGIIAGVLNIITRKKARAEPRSAFGAAFGVISACVPAQWDQVAGLAGRFCDRLLLPPGVSSPPPLREAAFPRYRRVVMAATACEIIKRTRMPMYRRVAGLADKTGKYAGILWELLCHFTTAVVVTENAPVYEAESERIMAALGAPVIIAQGGASFADCVLVLAPEGLPEGAHPRCPVISYEDSFDGRCDWVSGPRVRPPPEVSALCPPGIPAERFGAALYEFCGVEAAGFVAGEMLLNGRAAGLEQVTEAVGRRAGTIGLF